MYIYDCTRLEVSLFPEQQFMPTTNKIGVQRLINNTNLSAPNPKIFFRLHKSLHLFETHCAFLKYDLDFFIGSKS